MPTEASLGATSEESTTVNGTVDCGLLSAGQMLSAARKQHNLTQRDVADALRITVRYVNAIEQDEHDKLPGAVFAKGYIKRYAKIMVLDETAVLAAYDGLADVYPAVIAGGVRSQTKSRRTRSSEWARTASSAVFVGLFLGLWFWKGQESDAPDGSVDSVRIESSDAISLVQPSGPASVAPPESSLASGSATAEVRDAQIWPLENSQSAPVGEQATSELGDRTETDEESAFGMGVFKTSTYVEGEGGDTLKLSFSGTSWVEVKDGSDGKKYRDLRQAGDVLEIKGVAPFDVFLGDALRTRMTFNGDEIDLSQEIRIDNSVQLTLGL